MHHRREVGGDWIQLHLAVDQREVQDDHTLHPDGVQGGEVQRYEEVHRYHIGQILSSSLQELVEDGLVHREMYPQILPRVEYSLTEAGQSLIPILDGMCEWGDVHRAKSG